MPNALFALGTTVQILSHNIGGAIMKIIKNAIRCNLCHDEIESTSRHDFVWCRCGACAVDGGHDYLRRTFLEKGCYTDISIVEDDEELLEPPIRYRSNQD